MNDVIKYEIIEVSKEEWKVIKSKNSTLENKGKGKHTKYPPKSFYGERFIYAYHHPKK